MLLKIYRRLSQKDPAYRNPELPKSSVTLDNYRLPWRLLVKNRLPLYVPVLSLLLFVFLAFVMIDWYGDISKRGGGTSAYFLFAGVLVMIIWLGFSVFRAAIPNLPSTFRSQTFSYFTRWTTNILGFTGLTLLGTAAMVGFVEEYIISGNPSAESLPGGISNLIGPLVLGVVYFVILSPVLAFLYHLWAESWRVIKRVSTWWYRRDELVATFDKEVYGSGDEFKLQVRDKISENSGRRYRIHLSYVYEVTIVERERSAVWGADAEYENRVNYRRHLTYTKFRDVTAGELHDGISWAVPVFQKPGIPNEHLPVTKFVMGKQCRYWELLLEEHGSHFYARFFLNVG